MCAHFAGATYGASKRALTLEVVLQVQHGGLVGGERTRLAMSGWAVMAPLELFWPSTASMPVRERDRAAERSANTTKPNRLMGCFGQSHSGGGAAWWRENLKGNQRGMSLFLYFEGRGSESLYIFRRSVTESPYSLFFSEHHFLF